MHADERRSDKDDFCVPSAFICVRLRLNSLGMPLTQTWLGRDAIDRIGSIRLRCYGNKPTDLPDMIKRSQADRFEDGDVLILADETGDIASATSLSLSMNLRGTPVPCQ